MFAFVLFLLGSLAWVEASQDLPPFRLQVENLDCVLSLPPVGDRDTSYSLVCGAGFDVPNPRFSFAMNSPPVTSPRGIVQTAFQLQVFDYVSGKAIWDTDRVISRRSTSIRYAEYVNPVSPLASDKTYVWRVRTWSSSASGPSLWSSNASFSTAFLSTPFSHSTWLGAPSSPYYIFTSPSFDVPSNPRKATAYVCGLGYFRLYVNDHLTLPLERLNPAWTDFKFRCAYLAIDILNVLSSVTSNSLRIEVGNGWYGAGPGVGGPKRVKVEVWVDGSLVMSSSSSGWKVGTGPVVMDDVYNGETFDARRTAGDWIEPNVLKDDICSKGMSVQSIPPVKVKMELPSLSRTEVKEGVYVYDFGQNLAGWCRLRAGTMIPPPGTTISLHHGEILNADGTIYTKNLRSAKATDTFTFANNTTAPFEFEPFFTIHGFRFMQLEGWPSGTPLPTEVTAIHAYSSVSSAGTFSTDPSHSVLNRLHENIVWGQQDNLMTVPTDCDQRDERLGWMADGHLAAEEAIRNFDMVAFHEWWVRLMKDDQGADGSIPDVVPMFRYAVQQGDPSWAAAFVEVPWFLWMQTNDSSVIQENIGELKSYVDFMIGYWKGKDKDLKKFISTFGDWVPPPPEKKCSKELAASFYFLLGVKKLAKFLRLVGQEKTAEYYENLYSSELIDSFNKAFFDSKSSKFYDIGVQTALVLPLFLGDVVPEKYVEKVKVALLNDISSHDYHLTTGILGTKYLPLYLTSIGRSDIALRIASKFTYPSWGYMFMQAVETPATTLWELWDSPTGSPGMDSRNHIMFGSVDQWMYDHLAGLQVGDIEAHTVGSNLVSLSPPPANVILNSDVRLASATRKVSPNNRNEIELRWERTGGRVCSHAPENHEVKLDCGVGNVISAITFASYGLPFGACGGSGVDASCHAPKSLSIVSTECVGKQSCSVVASNAIFGGDPCYDKWKRIAVEAKCSEDPSYSVYAVVPANLEADVAVSELSFVRKSLTITEGGSTVWSQGTYVPGVAGIHNAVEKNGEIVFSVGSGMYRFEIRDAPVGPEVCGFVTENDKLNLTCPAGMVVSVVTFASFGLPSGECTRTSSLNNLAVGACDAGSSMHVVEGLCLGMNSCSVDAEDSIFGDPCFGEKKSLAVRAICS